MNLDSVPWWKNRRRLFYGATIVVLAAVPLGGSIWYHKNFPIPKQLANSSIRLHQIHDRLIRWKASRDLRELQLKGTIWEDSLTGGVAEFGADGVFSWKTLPSKKRHISKVHDNPEFAPLIGGASYRFDRNKGFVYWNDSTRSMSYEYDQNDESNLEFPGKNWTGHIGYDGRRLVLSVQLRSIDGGSDENFLMTFDRRVSP